MDPLAVLRRAALLLVLAATAAGCATPPDENRPGDLNCDADRDGIPDGDSPVEGANESCPDDAPMTPLVNETENPDENTTAMPSALP